MPLRQWINDHATTALTVAAVLGLGAAAALLWQVRDNGSYALSHVYFWDLEANEPFVAPRDATPPIEAPSGGRGVRANLYTCGECTPEEWFGYLETLPEEVNPAHEREDGGLSEADYEAAYRVRALHGERWYAREDGRDQAIARFLSHESCEGRTPTLCLP